MSEMYQNMKENTLDVLFYLFDNYAEADDVTQNRDVLHGYLTDAGFPNKRIIKAFDWLESLADDNIIYLSEPKSISIRHFSKFENRWLDKECQDYMLSLANAGVLSSEMFERTIDRVLSLGDREFDLNRLKWVILMLLLNQPDTEAEYIWMDDVALGEEPPVYH
jgi:Smg protein